LAAETPPNPAEKTSETMGLAKYISKLFPCTLLVCNVGAAICCAATGDYRRSVYWAASALCVGAIAF
jgi:hypothetical protein